LFCGDGLLYDELVEFDGCFWLWMWFDCIYIEGLMEVVVVYGYFLCVSEGNDLVILYYEGLVVGEECVCFMFFC